MRITAKGQVTIPQEIRLRLGLQPETEVEFDVVGNTVRIRKIVEDVESALPQDVFVRSPLADFYIGAHAAVAGLSLLTRDPARYRTHFPKLRLIAPAPAGPSPA